MTPLHLWLFGGAFGLIGACFAWQWAHRSECEKRRIEAEARLTKLETEMERAKADLLNARQSIHDLRAQVSPVVVDYQNRHER